MKSNVFVQNGEGKSDNHLSPQGIIFGNHHLEALVYDNDTGQLNKPKKPATFLKVN